MLTIYNENKRKLLILQGNPEAMLRSICETSIDKKTNEKLFSKTINDEIGKITFTSLSSTEAKINIGNVYLWKDYILIFEVS